MQNLTIKTIGCSMASVAALCYLSLSNPECNFQLVPEDKMVQWEANVFPPDYSNPYYRLINEEQLALSQIETLHKFVSTILDNSQDLNPDFSAVVDKHFWNLV
jgi:hypothetical protein